MNESGFMPVLDLEIRMSGQRVDFRHFSKSMSSPFCIMYRSAVSTKTKRDSLLQEGLRRIRNCSPGSDPNTRKEALTKYMWTLMVSGYDL